MDEAIGFQHLPSGKILDSIFATAIDCMIVIDSFGKIMMVNGAAVSLFGYEKEELVFYHSIVDLPIDPICLSLDEMFNITAHVGYHITPFFYFYGVINSFSTKIVIGPSRQIKPPDNILKEIAFKCDVEKEDIEQFIYGMKSIIPMPYESILQTLCTINYILNGEKLGLDDITIYDDEQKKLTHQITTKRVSESLSEEMYSSFDHNTL